MNNFVYYKDDLTIPGSYPLVFKRFYNALGTAEELLGRGWTHSHDTRLYKDESKVTITFGDGHAELYTCTKKAPGTDNTTYTTTPGNRNTLTKTDTGHTLTTPDGTAHAFNKYGQLTTITAPDGTTTQYTYEDGALQIQHPKPSHRNHKRQRKRNAIQIQHSRQYHRGNQRRLRQTNLRIRPNQQSHCHHGLQRSSNQARIQRDGQAVQSHRPAGQRNNPHLRPDAKYHASKRRDRLQLRRAQPFCPLIFPNKIGMKFIVAFYFAVLITE